MIVANNDNNTDIIMHIVSAIVIVDSSIKFIICKVSQNSYT